MLTLEEAKKAVVEDFSMYDEWLDKYEYLIELGKNLEPYPEEDKTDDKLIKGCQSRVWLDSKVEEGKVFFKADSDAIITKGIISLLISVYSGRTPEEIADDDFGFINEIGLKENLSPTRANGLVSMIEKIKELARESIGSKASTGDVLTAEDAKLIVTAVAKSPLVKTAVFGEDANWGRIITAAGYSGADFDPDKVNIRLAGLLVCKDGQATDYSEEEASELVKQHDIKIEIDLNQGEFEDRMFSCDFSYDYVKINGSYRT